MRKVLLVAPHGLGELPELQNPEIKLEVVRSDNSGNMVIVVSDIGVYAVSSKSELAKLLKDISRTSKG